MTPRQQIINNGAILFLDGYSIMGVFLPDKALAAAGVYSETVIEQLAPSQ